VKQGIIVPVTGTGRFPGKEILARGEAIAALVRIPLKEDLEARSVLYST
jgi:hypothetical protein